MPIVWQNWFLMLIVWQNWFFSHPRNTDVKFNVAYLRGGVSPTSCKIIVILRLRFSTSQVAQSHQARNRLPAFVQDSGMKKIARTVWHNVLV